MSNVISCRIGVLGSADTAFARFPDAGMLHAEVPPPADGDYDAIAAKARANGVTIATLATQLNLETDETTQGFRSVIDGASRIGVPKIFISAKAGDDVPRAVAIARLRNTAAYAAARGVTICMETHPPFGTNGDVARATLTEVDHTGLRFNFDTANVYYYNEGTDTIAELRKVTDLVAAVHLKDTDGGFRSGNFPPVGQGVVDFPSVFEMLGKQDFTGPYTLEIEGALVRELDEEGRVQFLRDCVDYLRSIGAMD